MKKTTKQCAFVLLLLLAGFLTSEAKEPRYNGKPLSQIICCSLPDEQYDAFSNLGTNCLPVVLDIMGATDKNMKWAAMRLESRELRDKAMSGDEGTLADIRESASRAFDMLGTNAVSAVPRLVKILEQNDKITAIYAADALTKVGPKGFIALTNLLSSKKTNTRVAVIGEVAHGDFQIIKPMLISFTKDKDPEVRQSAAEGLSGRDSEVAIPLLIPLLDDPSWTVKSAAASALGSYGAKAKSVLPLIASAYTNSILTGLSLENARTFSDALKAIDLEEAKKAEAMVINYPINPFRHYYTRTKLTNGMELVAGGYLRSDLLYPTNYVLSSAQLYDPKTGKWKETGAMLEPRYGHAAGLLPIGKVLIAGGSRRASAELYDMKTETWKETGSLKKENGGGQIILQPDGMALFVNGIDYPNRPPFDVELYDPNTGTWKEVEQK